MCILISQQSTLTTIQTSKLSIRSRYFKMYMEDGNKKPANHREKRSKIYNTFSGVSCDYYRQNKRIQGCGRIAIAHPFLIRVAQQLKTKLPSVLRSKHSVNEMSAERPLN